MAGNVEPKDANYQPLLAAVSPGTGLVVPQASATVLTDSASGQQYAPLVVSTVGSVAGTLQNAASGNITGSTLSLLGNVTIAFTITMSNFTGTVTFQGSEDGTNFNPLFLSPINTGIIGTTAVGAATTSITVYQGSCAGLQIVRAPISGYGGGSVTITAHAINDAFVPLYPSSAIVDGVNPSLRASVLQIHNADRQNPGSTAYGLLTGTTSAVVTPDGYLNRQTETGFDGIGSHGVTTSAQQFTQQFLTTATSGNIGVGAASAVIQTASPLGMLYANALTIDSGANAESVMISSIVGTIITIVPLNGAPTAPAFKFNHFAPFSVSGAIYNQERDHNGELDIPRGSGMPVAIPMLSLSSGQGTSNPVIAVRERGVQGLGDSVAVNISSGFAQGTLLGTLASAPTGLGAGTALYLSGGSGTPFERVLTALNYTPGSTSIILDPATPVQGIGRTQAQFKTFQASLGPALFYPEGEGGEFQLIADFASGKGAFAQTATANAAPYANSPLEAIGLDNGQTLDRMAGNQNLSLIVAIASSATIASLDQTNINARGVTLVLNVTSIGAGSVTLALQGKDSASQQYYSIFIAPPVTSAGLFVYTIYPGSPVSATSFNAPLPRTWRVQVIANNANPASYTVGASTAV